MTWMSLKPERARFFRISHPRPPAPLRGTSVSVLKRSYQVYTRETHMTLQAVSLISRVWKMRSAYRTFILLRYSMAFSPTMKESSSVKGPVRVRNLSRCFLQYNISQKLLSDFVVTSYHRARGPAARSSPIVSTLTAIFWYCLEREVSRSS